MQTNKKQKDSVLVVHQNGQVMINNDGSTIDVPIAFDTEANMTRYSCSMTFKNELYIFGGDGTRQVRLTKLLNERQINTNVHLN